MAAKKERAIWPTMPDRLGPYQTDLMAAAGPESEAEVEADWPEGTAALEAKAPRKIATLMVPIYHPHLTDVRIAHVWRERLKHRDRVGLAKAGKVPALWCHLTDGYAAVVQYNYEAWKRLTPMERAALVDHQLCHLRPGNGKLVLACHDVEEFAEIVGRWGLWQPDLEALIEQYDLWKPPQAPPV